MFLNEKDRRGRVCGSQMKVIFLNEKGIRGHLWKPKKVMFLNEKGIRGRLWKPNEGDVFE